MSLCLSYTSVDACILSPWALAMQGGSDYS